MELSWPMKLRIAAAIAAGVVLIGILAWPLAEPPEPFGVVSVLAGTITLSDAITLVVLSLLAGFIAYFLSWPYGREIGILAVPAGLALWAVRCGSMASLIQLKPTLPQRQQLLATLRWEPIFWLIIVAAGFAGVLIAQKIAQPKPHKSRDKSGPKPNTYLNTAIALVGSVLIAHILIRIFAQDVRMPDSKLGSVMAQPAVGQIVFAVLVSFGTAAFIFKKFLNTSYIWPTVASALVTAFAITTHLKADVVQHLIRRWPVAFFSTSVVSILPVQIVAFGALGSVAGYWMAVRYNYWRKHESK